MICEANHRDVQTGAFVRSDQRTGRFSELVAASVRQAMTGSKYWKSNLNIARGEPLDQKFFTRIPLLSREALLNIQPSDLSSCPDREVLGQFATSGTTGLPAHIRYSKSLMECVTKILSDFYRTVGLNSRSRVALAYRESGAAYAMHACALTHSEIQFFALETQDPQLAYDRLVRSRATALFAPAGAILRICDVQRSKTSEKPPMPRIVLSSGMPLSESGRRFIEESLNADVLRCAGATEVSLLALECAHKAGMHLLDNLYYPELLSGTNLGPNTAELVVTTLRNPACHLIRYRLGDVVELQRADCGCGSRTPLIRILGRAEDALSLTDGAPVPAASIQALIDELEGLTGGFRCCVFDDQRDQKVEMYVESWESEPVVLQELRTTLAESAQSVFARASGAVTGPLVGVKFVRPGQLSVDSVKYRRMVNIDAPRR